MDRRGLILVLSSVVVVLLQLIISPAIPVGGTTFNFCLAFVVAVSLTLNDSPKLVMCVILGVIMDLTQSGPVGAYALLFLVSNFVCISISANIASTEFPQKAVIAFITCAVANILHCLIVGITSSGIAAAFLSGALWSLIFDGIIALIFLWILSKLVREKSMNPWSSRY